MTDPVTLAVVRGALEQIADEMDLHLIFDRAISPIISASRATRYLGSSICDLIVEAA